MEFLKPFWIEILKYSSMAFGLFVVLFKIRQSGTQAEQRKQAMETLKAIKAHDKIERNINTLNDDAINKLYEQELKRD